MDSLVTGIIATVLSNSGLLFQMYQIIKNKSAEDLNYVAFIFMNIQSILWGFYSYFEETYLGVIANCIGVVLISIIICLKYYYSLRILERKNFDKKFISSRKNPVIPPTRIIVPADV